MTCASQCGMRSSTCIPNRMDLTASTVKRAQGVDIALRLRLPSSDFSQWLQVQAKLAPLAHGDITPEKFLNAIAELHLAFETPGSCLEVRHTPHRISTSRLLRDSMDASSLCGDVCLEHAGALSGWLFTIVGQRCRCDADYERASGRLERGCLRCVVFFNQSSYRKICCLLAAAIFGMLPRAIDSRRLDF